MSANELFTRQTRHNESWQLLRVKAARAAARVSQNTCSTTATHCIRLIPAERCWALFSYNRFVRDLLCLYKFWYFLKNNRIAPAQLLISPLSVPHWGLAGSSDGVFWDSAEILRAECCSAMHFVFCCLTHYDNKNCYYVNKWRHWRNNVNKMHAFKLALKSRNVIIIHALMTDRAKNFVPFRSTLFDHILYSIWCIQYEDYICDFWSDKMTLK